MRGAPKKEAIAEDKVAAMPEDPINSGIVFGEAFIALGIFSLLAAVVQYGRILKRIDNPQYIYTPSRALPMITAIALLAIGLFGFIAILL